MGDIGYGGTGAVMDAPIEPNGWAVLVAAAAVAVGGAAAAVSRILRGWSRDRTEIVKDGVEAGLVERLQERADSAIAEAEAAREHRISDAQKIALLTAENQYLQRDVARLTDEIRKMFRTLDPRVQEVLVTDFAELDSKH